MNINLNIEELCSVFKIDTSSTDKGFIGSVDLIRKDYKVSQENFCKMVGISRALYTKAKKGDKGIGSENKLKILRELARIKEISALEENATRMTVSSNSSKGMNKYSMEKSVSPNEAVREMKEALWKTIQAKQKIKRNSKYFEPSLDASTDKITLFVRLVEGTEKMFLDVMSRFAIVSGNTKYLHNARYKSGKVTEYAHIWQYEGSDCKVHVQYLYYDKRVGTDIRELKVEFNPNKWKIEENEMIVALMPYLSKNPRIKEFDVCKDFFGYKDSNIILPKELFEGGKGSIKVFSEDDAKTIYYGDKNKTVNLMIYDKRKEILKKDNKDIGFDCLRAESRYKLKPSEWKGEGANRRFVEYRVKLSDIDKVPLPLKLYVCQAHYFEKDELRGVKAEDVIMIQALLNGGINLHNIMSVDKDIASRLVGYMDSIHVEKMCITQTDVSIALNSFVFKYLDCIDRFYNVGNIEGVSEVWKVKSLKDNFEVLGLADWDTIEEGFVGSGVGTSFILSRDENF